MLEAHVIGFYEKEIVNHLSRIAPLGDRMDVNDFKFSRSPYAIESAGSSITSRVQRSTPQRPSPDRAEAVLMPFPERPSQGQHAGTPPQRRRSPQTESDAADAGVNEFGSNVDVLEC